MPPFSYPTPILDEGGGERKGNDNDRDSPTVGSSYNGSKVIDVEVEVSDRGARIRTRSIIKLENGAILKQDHWKDKVFQEVETARRRAPVRSKSNDNDLSEIAAGSAPGLSRGLGPKTKSGRQLPKPVAAPRKAAKGQSPALPPSRSESPASGSGRRGSRGYDFIRGPPGVSKSSDLEELQVSSHNPRGRRPSGRDGGGHRAEEGDISPEPTPRPSLRNMSNFLISPKRQPPRISKSGSDLDDLRDSLHIPGGMQLPPRVDGKPPRRTSAKSAAGSIDGDAAPETPQRKPMSLKKLGVLMSPRVKPAKSRSGELESMQDSLKMLDLESKSEPFTMEKRSSLPTTNLDDLRDSLNIPGGTQLPPRVDGKPPRRISAKSAAGSMDADTAPETPQRKPMSLKKLGVMITPRVKPAKSRSGELESMQDSLKSLDLESKSEPFTMEKRSSLPTTDSNKEKLRSFKDLITMPAPKRSTRSASPAAAPREQDQKSRRGSLEKEQHQQVPEKSRRESSKHRQPSPSSATRRGSTSQDAAAREPSLSPEQVKKPASSSYITSFLDSLYDSYVDHGDEDSDEDGFGKSQSLLESSLNRFVEWAE